MKRKLARETILKVLMVTILSFFIIGIFHQYVQADSMNNFSIQTLDQAGKVNQRGFYHLTGQPGEKQKVAVKVYNASKEEITVKATVNSASTNKNGIPSYTGEEHYDSSLKYRMDELISIENPEIKIPASDAVTMDITVSFPEEAWEGDLLGGIRFTEESTQKSDKTVVHEVAYTVGVLLNQTDGHIVENNLHLHKVAAGQRNYRNYIEANIQNSAASIIREMSVQTKVFVKKSKTPIYTYEAYKLRMAPNSNFNFGIPTGDQPIKAGDYLLEMTIKADGKEYQFQKDFTIKAQEARQLNQSAVNLTNMSSNVFLLYVGVVGLVLVLLLLFVWGHQRKKNAIKKIA